MIWSKNAFIIKAGLAFTAFLAACGGDSSNKADPSNNVLREVSTIYDLGACSADRYGDTVFVHENAVDYLCLNNDWVDITTPIDNQPGIPENGLSSYIDNESLSSSSFVEWETKDSIDFIVKDASILGAAQKGPFKVKSLLSLSEVFVRNDTLVYSGRIYNDEISSNKGDFVIPKVTLIYPYAVLEVRGQWRNEISGEYSRDSMTLRVLTDLSNRTEVNINLLTHLEFDRAVKLISEGYNVYAAKTQAEHEIVTAFGFATTVEYSEDLKTFVPSTNISHDANATLMAISLLFIADKNGTDIQKTINDFRSDFAEDGSWDNEQMKANMADWAEAFDGGSIRANVKKWNILDIPKYENFLTIFWNNAYGLGGCDQTRYGVVSKVQNKSSKNYGIHYICKENGWQKATDYEKDTYGWFEGKSGELKKGNVTDAIYVYKGSKWELTERETAIGLCENSNAGVVSEFNSTYYICKDNAWEKATVLEYDTYDKKCLMDGSIVSGGVVVDNKYVCDAGFFRELSNVEISLGKACVSYTENDTIWKRISEWSDSVYTCKSGLWIAEYVEEEGVLFDKRDSNVYRTVTIGTQIWMAENLNYSDSSVYVGMKKRSWCYKRSADSCAKYGRYYTWAAAMDCAGIFSSEGKGCGYNKGCFSTKVIRGICPEGWHLPTRTEWETLYSAMDSSTYAMQAKGIESWPNATDLYTFSAFPVGYTNGGADHRFGVTAYFWTALDYDISDAFFWYIGPSYASSSTHVKFDGFPVRCVKD